MNDPVVTLENLYAAVVADVLDRLGHRHQTLSTDITALTAARKVCGRVFTARAVAVDTIPDEPYKLEMSAVDTMQAGDVLVVVGAAQLMAQQQQFLDRMQSRMGGNLFGGGMGRSGGGMFRGRTPE